MRAFIPLLFCGCLAGNQSFRCNSDSDCDVTKGAKCIANACASPVDGGCPSGYRWNETSPFKSQCAEFDMAMEIPDLIPAPDLTSCGNGTIDPGEQCDPGIAKGLAGACPDCDDNNPCTKDLVGGCVNHCTYSPMEGASCLLSGLTGICHQYSCCTGCWNGASCASGEATTVCGLRGASCADCTSPKVPDGGTSECYSSSCTNDVDAGACTSAPVTDGTKCGNNLGTCQDGQCCTGCVDNSGKCLPGTAKTACGSGGNSCLSCQVDCTGQQCTGCVGSCSGKECGDNGCGVACPNTCPSTKHCNINQCACNNAPGSENSDALCSNGIDDDCDGKIDCADDDCNLHSCSPNGGKFCHSKSCTEGCRINGSFTPKDQQNGQCKKCDPAQNANDWSPLPGTTCQYSGNNGKCDANGSCCIGCLNNQNACKAGTGTDACGAGGASCTTCPLSNTKCKAPSCQLGICGFSTQFDGAFCNAPPHACGTTFLECSPCASNNCTMAATCYNGVCDPNHPKKTGCCTKLAPCAIDNLGNAACSGGDVNPL